MRSMNAVYVYIVGNCFRLFATEVLGRKYELFRLLKTCNTILTKWRPRLYYLFLYMREIISACVV